MAQTLKEEVRKRIENAAINQLIINGMHKTNMRDIAKEAGITPGNLYRYYTNKDQLIISITAPIVDGLNLIVEKETAGKLNLASTKPDLPLPPPGIDVLAYVEDILLSRLRRALIEIGSLAIQYPKPMAILLDDSIVSKKLYAWGISIITQGYTTCFKANGVKESEIDTMIKVVTMSFCEGIIQLLKAVLDDHDEKRYLKMLDYFLIIERAGIAAILKQELIKGTITVNL
ncbi:hypothetical protein SDC9_135689 [bioreactor metagenome]|uniref:HTH tetR-type domain-containing protein n=1 Tax=bioreactor metagenome TaxID=1076179 RepID=A0A645DH97_9ZZZZ|nr:TetR/AcrR family transcriptional regulator [Erysipelotrichaceae bacterium]